MAEFNICLTSAHAAGTVVMMPDRVYPQTGTIEKHEETGMRLKLLSPGEMSAEQKETYDESIAGKRGAPPAPMLAWLNSPEMARHATRLGAVLRFDTIFPAKLSEIAILVTARHWTSHYEWYAHKRLALKGGMDPKIIEDIRDRRTPHFDDPRGQMIYDVAKSLHEGHGLSQALYDEAVELLTVRGVVEIIGLCGYYTMVSMTLNTFEFELPAGEVSELA
jgi:4-carboxymuconolactone decarboxylase